MIAQLHAFARRAAASDFARSGLLVFAAVILGNVFNFVYLLLLGRALDVLDYGVVMALVSVVSLITGAGSIIQIVTAKVAADLRAADDLPAMAAFVRGIVRLSLLLAGGATVLALGAQKVIADYLHLEHSDAAAVAGVIGAVGFAILFQRGCFQGFGQFKDYTISWAVDVFRMLLVFPLSLAYGAVGSMLAMLVSVLASAVYGHVALQRQFGRLHVAAARLDIRRMLITASATGSSSFGIAFLMFYDVALARHFLNPLEAGLYGAASLIGKVLLTTISFIPTVLLPQITMRVARGHSVTTVLIASVALSALLIGPMALVCGFAPVLVIRILAGVRFLDGAYLVLPYVLAAGTLGLANVLATYAVGRHRFGFVPYLWVLAAAEITLVTLRHGTALAIVEDLLIGHGAVCCMMIVWTIQDVAGLRAKTV